MNIPVFKVFMPKSVNKPLLKVLHSGYIGQGKKVEKFEKKFSDYVQNPYALALNSGTSAIHLALRLSNVNYQDEVITTPLTCVGAINPILASGAKIVWADVNPISGNIDPKDIERKITSKTKAMIILDFGRNLCDIEKIQDIAQKHNIKIIEDASHSLGSRYKSKMTGSYSDFTVFSFQAVKHITTIDGGMLLCKSKEDYKRGKLLRWFGVDREKRDEFRCADDIKEFGYRYNMNDVNAVIGLEQLKYLKKIVKKHIKNCRYFDKKLKDIKGIKTIPANKQNISSAWIYPIHVEKRELFMRWMQQEGIHTSRVHERNDIHQAFKEFKTPLPNLEIFNKTQVSIPVGWWIGKKERKYIVKKIREFSKKYL